MRSWDIPSESKEWKSYTVRCIQGEWSCTCYAFIRWNDCKHIETAKELLGIDRMFEEAGLE